ncbi:MAG: sigma-70 family RNA polymerase sigma factor [Planctomycetota bacterium]
MSETHRSLLARYAQTQDPELAEALVSDAWPLAYRVCRKALGDAQRAEDAAQEAVIRLLELADRFEADRRFEPWVAALAANVAREHARSQGRRQRREERAARPAGFLEQGADRLELDEVRAAVLALPEEVREPVVLHYYGGLTYREVAVETGVSEGTAASRIRSGKQQLKARLQEAGYSVSSVTAALGWLQATLEVEVPPAPGVSVLRRRPPARPVLGAPLLGGLALLVVAGALGVALWPARAPAGPEAPAPGDVASVASEADEGAPGDGAPAAPTATAPAQQVGDPPREAAPPGADVAVARVQVRLQGQGELNQPWVLPLPQPEVEAELEPLLQDVLRGIGRRGGAGAASAPGPEGFAFELAPGSYWLVAGAAGHGTAVQPLRVTPGEQTVTVSLPYVGVAQLEVEVADVHGQLLLERELSFSLARPGQAVRATILRTDAQGVARLDVPAGASTLYATDPEAGRTSAASLELAPGSAQRVRLSFQDAQRGLRVRVLDRVGNPVSGAAVAVAPAVPESFGAAIQDVLRLPAREGTVFSGPDGVAEFSELDATWYAAALAVARHETWGGRSQTVALDDPSAPAEVTLTLDEPLEGGHLAVHLYAGEGRDRPLVRGDPQEVSFNYALQGAAVQRYGGSFRAEDDGTHTVHVYDLPPGPLQVSFWGSAAGTTYAAHTGRVEIRRGQLVDLELHFEVEALEATLQVLDPDGAPFRGSVAWVPPVAPDQRVGLTDRQPGRFTLDVHPARPYGIVAWGPGTLPTRVDGIEPAADAQVTLPAGGSYEVQVVDPAGAPIAGAALTCDGLGAWQTWTGDSGSYATDADGRLALQGVIERSLPVVATARGYRRAAGTLSPDAPTLRLVLAPEPEGPQLPLLGPRAQASLSGRVVDAQGAPLVGVAFQAIGPSGYGAGRRERSRADGGFFLPKCEAGEVVVRAYRGDLGLSAPVVVQVEEDAAVSELELVLRPGVRLAGRVVRPELSGEERVSLLDAEGRDWSRLGGKHSYGVQVNPAGGFDLGPLPPGTWTLVVKSDKRGHELTRRTVELVAGAPLEVELSVE